MFEREHRLWSNVSTSQQREAVIGHVGPNASEPVRNFVCDA
jgi:hypothetical protein